MSGGFGFIGDIKISAFRGLGAFGVSGFRGSGV